MAERGEVADRFDDDAGLVVPNCWKSAVFDRPADDDRRQSETDELVDSRIDMAQVGDQDPVDAPLAEPAAVHLDLSFDRLDQLDRQGNRPCRELRLDARDELHEERLEGERSRRPREYEPTGVGPFGRQRTCCAVRIPAELASDLEDPLPRAVGDARPPVQGVRDRALRDSGALRDVADRDSASATCGLGHFHSPSGKRRFRSCRGGG
jgi:hypothetical protein